MSEDKVPAEGAHVTGDPNVAPENAGGAGSGAHGAHDNSKTQEETGETGTRSMDFGNQGSEHPIEDTNTKDPEAVHMDGGEEINPSTVAAAAAEQEGEGEPSHLPEERRAIPDKDLTSEEREVKTKRVAWEESQAKKAEEKEAVATAEKPFDELSDEEKVDFIFKDLERLLSGDTERMNSGQGELDSAKIKIKRILNGE